MSKLTSIIIISAQSFVNFIETTFESSSDEDDILNIVKFIGNRGPLVLRPRVKNYIENVVVSLSDEGFKEHFRMSRDTFNFLLSIIKSKLEKKNGDDGHQPGRKTIDPEKQLLIAIWTFATPDSYRSICDRFDVGKATAWRSIKRVVNALVNLREYYIKWPTEEEALETATVFEQKKGFPGILGVIDGTHVKIEAPQENHESYINRKGYHSIQLQVVCNHKMAFIHCFVGYPGSVHDQRVFNVSELQDFCSDETKFPNNTHLIGDAAYQISKTMLVPYKDNGHLTESRFRFLLDTLPMRRVDLIPNYIMACCILHNICLMKNDMIEIPIIVEDRIENNAENINCNVLYLQGKEKRDRIKDDLPLRLL